MSLLMPKKVKHRKMMNGSYNGIDRRGTTIAFGTIGLKSLGSKWITSRQIEAGRRAILRYIKKQGKLWIRVFPAKPVTKKGAETPMGGGKGGVDHYVCPIREGRIIFELDGLPEKEAREALTKAAIKLPVKTKIVKK